MFTLAKTILAWFAAIIGAGVLVGAIMFLVAFGWFMIGVLVISIVVILLGALIREVFRESKHPLQFPPPDIPPPPKKN